MRSPRIRALIAAGAALTCVTASAQTAPPSTTRPATTRPALTRPAVLAAPAAIGPAGRPPSPDGIDWRGAVGGLRQSGNAGPGLGRGLDPAAVDKTKLPILLPADADLMGGARIYSFGDYYSITANLTGARVSLTGTAETTPLPAGSKLNLPAVGPEQLVVQRTVDGQLASFVRYGVLYTVELRCDAPSDARCRTEGFVRGLVAKSTVVVMGKAARQAAGLGA
ncbi:hypothetical protein [Phenylobacterium sp.]|uniref:hypothetical protein n=1 Tax=Phenylobacterium sp. TaxID=1871053 RepID=UPI003BA95A74